MTSRGKSRPGADGVLPEGALEDLVASFWDATFENSFVNYYGDESHHVAIYKVMNERAIAEPLERPETSPIVLNAWDLTAEQRSEIADLLERVLEWRSQLLARHSFEGFVGSCSRPITLWTGTVSLLGQGGLMDLQLGATVRFNGRVYQIRGFTTPMGVGFARVTLEDSETLEVIEVAAEQLVSEDPVPGPDGVTGSKHASDRTHG